MSYKYYISVTNTITLTTASCSIYDVGGFSGLSVTLIENAGGLNKYGVNWTSYVNDNASGFVINTSYVANLDTIIEFLDVIPMSANAFKNYKGSVSGLDIGNKLLFDKSASYAFSNSSLSSYVHLMNFNQATSLEYTMSYLTLTNDIDISNNITATCVGLFHSTNVNNVTINLSCYNTENFSLCFYGAQNVGLTTISSGISSRIDNGFYNATILSPIALNFNSYRFIETFYNAKFNFPLTLNIYSCRTFLRAFMFSSFNSILTLINYNDQDVSFENTFSDSSFNNIIVNIESIRINNLAGTFANSPYYKSIATWNFSRLTRTPQTFKNCIGGKLNTVLNLSYVNDTSYMYSQCDLGNVDISLNLPVVQSVEGMFKDCSNFNGNVDIYGNTSVLFNMNSMFSGCNTYNKRFNFDISNNTNVDINSMFFNCNSFNQPLTNLSKITITNGDRTFYNCKEFNQDISNWNTSSISNMDNMFYGCSKFNQNLGKWNWTGLNSRDSIFRIYLFMTCNLDPQTYSNFLVDLSNNNTWTGNYKFIMPYFYYNIDYVINARNVVFGENYLDDNGGYSEQLLGLSYVKNNLLTLSKDISTVEIKNNVLNVISSEAIIYPKQWIILDLINIRYITIRSLANKKLRIYNDDNILIKTYDDATIDTFSVLYYNSIRIEYAYGDITSNNRIDIPYLYVTTSIILPVPSQICFVAKTPVLTDQGLIAIEKINVDKHTIRNKKIVKIVETILDDDKIVLIEKNGIYENIPNQDTKVTRNHKIMINGEMIKAKMLINGNTIKLIKHDKSFVYNVLMETHNVMNVNGMIVETLYPNNFE